MSEPRWIWQSNRVIPSEIGAARPVTQEVLRQLKRDQWVRRDIFSVQLAMEEALANAIKHGNQLAPDKEVNVVCRIAPSLVQIEITDEGNGFDPTTIPDPTDDEHLGSPCGRGVMLIRSFMSRVEFNAKGNQILMEKDRAS